MRAVVQRVKAASVSINQVTVGKINSGLLVFLGVETADNAEDINWLVKKILGLRVFTDADGKMNLSALDIRGELLIVSQFTLHASTKKGNRPSFVKSAKPIIALPLYEVFIEEVRKSGLVVETGNFGADMQVNIHNDGPVTLIIDSKNKE